VPFVVSGARLRVICRAPQVWLQEFAWSEAERPEKVAIRNGAVPDSEQLQLEPMFCFGTLFYRISFVIKQVNAVFSFKALLVTSPAALPALDHASEAAPPWHWEAHLSVQGMLWRSQHTADRE
jgi:hypothetical protein